MAMSQAERDAENVNWTTYLATEKPKDDAKQHLANTDKEMARVVEDVIDLLITKGNFTFSELPQDAQDLITARQASRTTINS